MKEERTCAACGYSFVFDPTFFAERDLKPPRRCRSCRAARRARRVMCTGRVISLGVRFGIILANDGQDYVCDPLPPEVRVGARVTFEALPDEQRERNRRPEAYDVHPA